jgi:hypothetical protein
VNCPGIPGALGFDNEPRMTPSGPSVPRNTERPLSPIDVVARCFHVNTIVRPENVPVAGPTALGPRHVPEIRLPAVTNLQIGATVPITGRPTVPLTLQVPENSDALAATGSAKATAIPRRLLPKRSFLLERTLQLSLCLTAEASIS